MNRRRFIGTAVVGVAALAWPVEPDPVERILESDDDYVARMRRDGKPIAGRSLKLTKTIRLSSTTPAIRMWDCHIESSADPMVLIEPYSPEELATSPRSEFVSCEFKATGVEHVGILYL